MANNELQLTIDSLRTELAYYKDKPYECLYEYIWNSFDAGATEIKINFILPKSGVGGVESLTVEDNGLGWDFEKEKNTKTFLSSSKSTNSDKHKTLPRGRFGRGRYVFIWVSKEIEILSVNQRLLLGHDTSVNPVIDNSAPKGGTKISFIGLRQHFSNIFFNKGSFSKELVSEFCWFLKENPTFSIIVNNEKISIDNNIKENKILDRQNFDEGINKYLTDKFAVEIVLWKEKPAEWSNFYFIDEDKKVEYYVESTGMNKKSDSFWHSVYVRSDLFEAVDSYEDVENQLDLGDKERRRVKQKIKNKIKEKLVELRKPYLEKQSNVLISQFKEDNIIPNLHDFGIFDEKAYEDLLRTVYIIAPSLFVGRDKKEQKFMCATIAGLVSVQDNNLIRLILEQLQSLTAEEQADLFDILQRTSLSCVVRTIKEVDSRLQTITDLETLLFKYKKQTLEVKHLQSVLNNNFWIFGEQFRLFRHTEGALKKTLYDYAKEVLEVEDPEIITDSKKEVDLFLTRTENINENQQKNIIIEIKRPSVKLGKKEYDQIEGYCQKIKSESVCNGGNQYWEFYLIGDDYDVNIADKISSASNYGEKDRGLTFNPNNGKYKIYVRKWSDILQTEWGYKMKYLKEKLEIEMKDNSDKLPDDIASSKKTTQR
ncbi:hypothetical protein A2223_02280 [Candidatus Falkowbacteria bacterium RIFOXYA2_FULL_35_8]|nr:MAG: hypothetical protein A2223_02280 [Candidatus Falkowbacteria bacterium RIFOXYA2_FULL_35_8]